MARINKDSAFLIVFTVLFTLALYMLASSWYLDLDVPAKYRAVYVGLAVASAFLTGFLFMYSLHKLDVMAVEAYAEVLAKDINRILNHLKECEKECLCASEAYIRLLFASTLVEGISRSVKRIMR
jgi:hypothetical protein